MCYLSTNNTLSSSLSNYVMIPPGISANLQSYVNTYEELCHIFLNLPRSSFLLPNSPLAHLAVLRPPLHLLFSLGTIFNMLFNQLLAWVNVHMLQALFKAAIVVTESGLSLYGFPSPTNNLKYLHKLWATYWSVLEIQSPIISTKSTIPFPYWETEQKLASQLLPCSLPLYSPLANVFGFQPEYMLLVPLILRMVHCKCLILIEPMTANVL